MASGSPTEMRIDYVVMLLTYSGMGQYQHTTHIKNWGVRVYIINGHVTQKNLDNRYHNAYSKGYAATIDGNYRVITLFFS